ncbi:RNA 2',3'-cyclic phosphodiesterase [Gracilibacillus oryzae]|uniref:RNA 2',3'-cyclic phosphodiesterase n=1 Tax=Gracilibacillus oryzae TaxID=1672701 RepID=A0A7C8GVH5_9BACI|nr:RNA 2',3'-cyclic phosphodiesterase [Gracilibacillus oryzae]KAB8138321.1 RNA 2',3'-cyclic phosphodiesterase [Gracilibacillus oryzae]
MKQGDPHYFVAVKIDENTKKFLNKIQENIKTKSLPFKVWIHEQDFHITLQFLGATSQDKITELSETLMSMEELPAFTTTIGHLKTFGKSVQPRVLWVDVERTQAVRQLHQLVTDKCKELGLPTDTRSYQPHITLAKKWHDKNLHFDQTILEDYQERKMDITEVAIYKINLNSKIKYEPIAVFRLASN